MANVIELKKQGKKGEEIIQDQLAKNSSLYKRTLLSQEKIMKKLEIRHKYQIFISAPTLFNLMEAIYIDPSHVKVLLNMRVDTVALILQSLCFLNKAKTIIYDETNGFITGVIAGRSEGTIINVFETRPTQKEIPCFNYNKAKKELISYINIKNLIEKRQVKKNNDSITKNSELELVEKVSNTNNGDISSNQESVCDVKLKYIRNMYLEAFTNLVVCCKDETKLLEYVLILYPYLKASGSIVVYGRDKEVSFIFFNNFVHFLY